MSDAPDRDDPTDDAPDRDDPTDRDAADSTDTPADDAADTSRAPRTTDPERSADGDPESTFDGDPEGDAVGGNGRFDRLSTDDLRGLIDRVGLAALILLALIAGWSFYSQAGRAIRTWLDPAYQPIALAAFNLAVLLVALAGVAHQLYRIRRSERDASAEGAE